MLDNQGRNIRYLRLSVTDRCNFRCRYCMPAEGVCKREHSEMLSFEELTEIVRTAVSLGVSKVRLTGGEPLVRRGIVDLCRSLRAINGVRELTMTTNGALLPQYAAELKQAGVDRLNISLDTLNKDKFASLTRGGSLADTLAGLDAGDIREPQWRPESTRQKQKISDYIARLCDGLLELYHNPPSVPQEGEEENGWWTRRKHIFYDTDMLRESQRESWRLCPDCSGLGCFETSSERVARSLCLLIPRHACPRCRAEAEARAAAARKAGLHAHVLVLDGDAALK